MRSSRNERELGVTENRTLANGRTGGHARGRSGRPSGGIEFELLELRVLWSAAPHPLAAKVSPARHLKPVVVRHHVTPRIVVPKVVKPKVVAPKVVKPKIVAAPVPTLAAPSALAATAQSWGMQLTWTDHVRVVGGYHVLRSVDGADFTLLATLAGARVSSYSDVLANPGHTYAYEVQAYYGKRISAYSDAATVTIPPVIPAAPAGLSASAVGWTSVDLAWAAPAGSVDGYLVFRSTDGASFSQIAQLTSGATTADVDAAVSAGQTYWYKVEAYNSGGTSADSAIATAVVPPDRALQDVNITTRFGDELVVTVSGTGDSIALSQSGSTLTVNADGDVYTETVPAAGLFVYTRGGSNSVSVGSSVSVRTTIETIDNAPTVVTSAGSNVSAWVDASDVFGGAGTVHRVASFAGGVSKATGASLANPSDSGAVAPVDLSLWGTGPVASDVNQGEVGDCYFLSSLAAFAGVKPSVLTESAVDMGDGTYVVQFQTWHANTYVRVDGDMPAGPFGGYMFAHPGADNTMWAMVLEKAFADYRTGENTYASISGGWMSEVYADLGVSGSDFVPSQMSEAAFYNMVATDLSHGDAVTLATPDAPPDLVGDHAYTLVSASVDSSGVTHYVVRNPWGVSGDAVENGQGYATLTFAQLTANFDGGYQALA